MRIVLDSSVLIAAIARPGVCTELVDEVARDHILLVSEHILGEVGQKLREKFEVPAEEVAEIVSSIRACSELVVPASVPPEACRDANDLPILGAAIGGRANLLITVDKDMLSLGSFRGIPVIKPGEFWRHLSQAD